jgi:hypothetical protein
VTKEVSRFIKDKIKKVGRKMSSMKINKLIRKNTCTIAGVKTKKQPN